MTTRSSQRRRWKRVELEIARRIGGERIPLLGRKGADVETPLLFVEVKSQKRIGAYLWDEFAAQILAGKEEANDTRIPALALHRPGVEYDDALICVRAGDWKRLVKLVEWAYQNTVENRRS